MSLLAKAVVSSIASLDPPDTNKVSALKAGEDIEYGDACYIKSDGKIWKANGTAANAAAVVAGFALRSAKAGGGLTLGFNIELEYAAGLTPGTPFFLAATAGRLDTAATTGGTQVIARAKNATTLFVYRDR